MNSLVFNTTADELRTSVYAYNQDTQALQLLQLNSAGELLISGGLGITNTMLTISGDMTLTNTLLTVAGDVTITNTLLTVEGNVTIANTLLTVAGDITVAGNVTITNTLLTVFMEGNQFTSNSQDLTGINSTGIALGATNISQLRTATMFVNNTGDNPITVTLQLSPDGITYFNDPNYNSIVVDRASSTVIVIGIFAQYAQIEYDAGTLATFSVYYNGQA